MGSPGGSRKEKDKSSNRKRKLKRKGEFSNAT
jgi:hypothetical protein